MQPLDSARGKSFDVARGRYALAALAYFAIIALTIGVIPSGAIVLDLPIGATAENVPAEYLAVMGGYRAINGYSGYVPPHFAALREALASHQSTAFDSFRRLDDLYVIVRPAVDARFLRWLETQPGGERLSGTPGWTLYRMPRIGEGAPTTLPVPLPAPGAFAFRLRN